jgi:hypothetical protein
LRHADHVAESTDVTSIPPPGLTVEVLVAGLLFSVSAGLTGLAALSPQSPPSVLLLLGWPMFAVVGGILLDQRPGLRLGRTFVALSLAPGRDRGVEPRAIGCCRVARSGGSSGGPGCSAGLRGRDSDPVGVPDLPTRST